MWSCVLRMVQSTEAHCSTLGCNVWVSVTWLKSSNVIQNDFTCSDLPVSGTGWPSPSWSLFGTIRPFPFLSPVFFPEELLSAWNQARQVKTGLNFWNDVKSMLKCKFSFSIANHGAFQPNPSRVIFHWKKGCKFSFFNIFITGYGPIDTS